MSSNKNLKTYCGDCKHAVDQGNFTLWCEIFQQEVTVNELACAMYDEYIIVEPQYDEY